MQRHLDAPCSKCHATVELLGKIEATAQADAQLNVPESAVRIARAIFALNKPEEVHLKPGILARLAFDSFREPTMAGVRSGRQLAPDFVRSRRLHHRPALRARSGSRPGREGGSDRNRVVPELSPHSVRSSCAADGRNSATPSPISLASLS